MWSPPTAEPERGGNGGLRVFQKHSLNFQRRQFKLRPVTWLRQNTFFLLFSPKDKREKLNDPVVFWTLLPTTSLCFTLLGEAGGGGRGGEGCGRRRRWGRGVSEGRGDGGGMLCIDGRCCCEKFQSNRLGCVRVCVYWPWCLCVPSYCWFQTEPREFFTEGQFYEWRLVCGFWRQLRFISCFCFVF